MTCRQRSLSNTHDAVIQANKSLSNSVFGAGTIIPYI
jgi:hypothetical protein